MQKKANNTISKELGQTECKKSVNELLKTVHKKGCKEQGNKNAKSNNQLCSRTCNKSSKNLARKYATSVERNKARKNAKVVRNFLTVLTYDKKEHNVASE